MHLVKYEHVHLLIYFISIFCLSQSALWVKWTHAPIETLGFWRLGLAFVILFLYFRPKDFLRKQPFHMRSLVFAILAGVFFFAHLWTYKYAALNTRIANSMIIFSTNPIYTALASVLFFREKISGKTTR